MKKTLIMVALFFISLLLLTGNTLAATLFTDIDDDKHKTAIEYLRNEGIIKGYEDGTFRPKNTVNRAELLKILVAGRGLAPDEKYHYCFPDVNDEWFAKYICYAKEQGWVQGYPDGEFKPAQTVNKVEAITMLVNTQGYGVELVKQVEEKLFKDTNSDFWYAPYLKLAKDKGILEETGEFFSPSDGMMRGGISENIFRVIVLQEMKVESFSESLVEKLLDQREKLILDLEKSYNELSQIIKANDYDGFVEFLKIYGDPGQIPTQEDWDEQVHNFFKEQFPDLSQTRFIKIEKRGNFAAYYLESDLDNPDSLTVRLILFYQRDNLSWQWGAKVYSYIADRMSTEKENELKIAELIEKDLRPEFTQIVSKEIEAQAGLPKRMKIVEIHNEEGICLKRGLQDFEGKKITLSQELEKKINICETTSNISLAPDQSFLLYVYGEQGKNSVLKMYNFKNKRTSKLLELTNTYSDRVIINGWNPYGDKVAILSLFEEPGLSKMIFLTFEKAKMKKQREFQRDISHDCDESGCSVSADVHWGNNELFYYSMCAGGEGCETKIITSMNVKETSQEALVDFENKMISYTYEKENHHLSFDELPEIPCLTWAKKNDSLGNEMEIDDEKRYLDKFIVLEHAPRCLVLLRKADQKVFAIDYREILLNSKHLMQVPETSQIQNGISFYVSVDEVYFYIWKLDEGIYAYDEFLLEQPKDLFDSYHTWAEVGEKVDEVRIDLEDYRVESNDLQSFVKKKSKSGYGF